MPARARKEIVDSKSPGYYLVTQRVVRGLRLTGVDPESGRDYSYRQAKLERRVRDLAGLYLIEIAEFTCGGDGFDLLVRTRPDLLPGLPHAEVARRMLRRSEKQLELKPAPTEEAVAEVLADPKRLAKMISRIANLSQFMGDVDEAMARDVNRETRGARGDLPLGRLWHGRFQSVRVLDPPALLLAATYVESKKVVDGEAAELDAARNCSASLRDQAASRASGRELKSSGVTGLGAGTVATAVTVATVDAVGSLGAEGTEGSFCAVGTVGDVGTVGTVGTVVEQVGQVQPVAQVEQLSQVKQAESAGDARADVGLGGGGPVDGPDAWLLPMTAAHAGQGLRPPSPSNEEERFETGPYLGVEYGEFRQLLRWTLAQSRSAVKHSGAALTEELASLFDRFRLRVDVWIEAVANFRTWFRTAIGLGDALKSFAKRLGVAWLAGQGRRRHPFTE